jgi:hypothetical protein
MIDIDGLKNIYDTIKIIRIYFLFDFLAKIN